MTNSTPRIFLVRAGRNGEDENYALENNVAIIGFTRYPSLSAVSSYEDIVNIIKNTTPEDSTRATGNFAGQLWAFTLSMQIGDIVVLPRKLTAQVALGRVTGPYKYQPVNGKDRHTRAVQWIRTDIPRADFNQDLLYSFGALLTVCNITRNNAAQRIQAILDGKGDPGYNLALPKPDSTEDNNTVHDLALAAHDQIVARIQSAFKGHDLAQLVEAVLIADGWTTQLSPPGPDGGVDILAGRGTFGLDAPFLCVQVKSQQNPADVTVYRNLLGTMKSFDANQALLVCWGGFNNVVLKEAKQNHFAIRLWESRDIVEAIYRTYDRLPAEIQAKLPLKRVWTLVPESAEQ